ncbi:uncharacterized protein LOC110458394 [Mizuhopecten yessoensis]|uniref:Uncharacterized protein n=1 Tax=Mizuhopecten yessoensis TaxID=6573 RepID=A0A210Q6Q8_MIZYE|nr:uncharacterized protein LOC110458394 [Mizuhopecten yessoensis]OWF44423.1 hypothetical protein KP79_PYT20490 [Mizuhopecten yessoensis]
MESEAGESCENAANLQTRIVIEDRLNEEINENTPDEDYCLRCQASERLGIYSAKNGYCVKVLQSCIMTKQGCVCVLFLLLMLFGTGIGIGISLSRMQTEVVCLTPLGQHENTNNSSKILQEIGTDKPSQTFPYKRQMESIDFNMANRNNLGLSYSEGVQPALMFRDGGVYNVSVSVMYDEKYCRGSYPSGTIHLRIERAEDRSKVGNDFSDSFSRHADKTWYVYGVISTKIEMQRGNGLRFITDYRDCIKADESNLEMEKLSQL